MYIFKKHRNSIYPFISKASTFIAIIFENRAGLGKISWKQAAGVEKENARCIKLKEFRMHAWWLVEMEHSM